MKKLVVLISGTGSNLQAILDACQRGELPAVVVAVISNKSDAYGLTRASKAGLDSVSFPKRKAESRQEYDTRLAALVSAYQPDYVVLAGWMRLLSSAFLDHFPLRVVNLHPALPGAFPGTHAIQRAYAAWQNGEIDCSGVMVHLVPDEGVDDGPVLAAEEIFFSNGESLENFASRVHLLEHRLLVGTLADMLS